VNAGALGHESLLKVKNECVWELPTKGFFSYGIHCIR